MVVVVLYVTIRWWRYGCYRVVATWVLYGGGATGCYMVVVLYVTIRWWHHGCYKVVAPWVL